MRQKSLSIQLLACMVEHLNTSEHRHVRISTQDPNGPASQRHPRETTGVIRKAGDAASAWARARTPSVNAAPHAPDQDADSLSANAMSTPENVQR